MSTIISSWFIFQNDHVLLLKENHRYQLPNDDHIGLMMPHFLKKIQIDERDGVIYWCAESSGLVNIPAHACFIPIRQALSLLAHADYGLAVKAHAVLRWDNHHQFCGRCGGHTVSLSKRFERRCITCEQTFFPRISPSIIVLIQRDNQLLLARGPNSAPGAYGLIAGFIEVGETIEEGVYREVMEEVGLTIKNLKYFGSQPWPFPDSLMIAFTADYADGEIHIDPHEIIEADWYPYDALPGMPSSPVSIATDLINDFVQRRGGRSAA